jgi:excinuclease ABC subunit C
MQNIDTFLNHLSHHPGVYQMLGENGEVLYVGKAKDLKKRVTSYFSGLTKNLKTQSLVKQIKDIEVIVTRSENEAVLLECNLIKRYRPRYNVLLRDDKSYPYILITNEHPFPRIDLYRGPKKKNGRYFGPYPSSHAVRETISLLQKLFKLRTCQDSYYEARTRPCLLYQIGRCAGPCVNLITEENYAQQVRLAILFLEGKSHQVIENLQQKMECSSQVLDYEQAAHYRNQIARLRQIQERQYINVTEGHADIIGLAIQAGIVCIQLLSIREGQILGSQSYFPSAPPHITKEEIISAFITQHYLSDSSHIESIPKQIIVDVIITDHFMIENVLSGQKNNVVKILSPVHGEKRKWLEMATNNAKQSLATHLLSKTNIQERMLALQEILGLKQTPQRIECFDVSHSMGESTVASCVVFNQEGPLKSHYRRFNITNITAGDDGAAMYQAILRRMIRLQKEAATLPDMIIIDGGQIQLHAASNVMTKLKIDSILLLAVSKGPDRRPGFETLHFTNRESMHLPSNSLALHFIQQIRDEAHRFAITSHRLRRDKTRRRSSLETISGIGAKRRRELLRYFGGIQGVAHASLDELMKVPGISRPLAERIFAAFHDTTI